jgi:hypothetical protein
VQARDVLPKVAMKTSRARTAALAFGMGALAGTLGFACSGEIDTNFGTPGAINGQPLPTVSGVPTSTGGGKKDSGGMSPCTYKAKEAGAPVEEAAVEAASDGATEAEASATDSAAEPEVAAPPPPAEGGSPAGSTCSVSWTKDIFAYMGAAGAWQCGNAACHGPGTFLPLQITDDETTTYNNMAATMVTSPTGESSLPLILPCSKDYTKSAFAAITTGVTFGPQMPLTTNGATLLTLTQDANVKTWILCGAPDN